MKTQKRWVDRGVNLHLVSESIEAFFKENGFKTKKYRLPEGWRISIAPQRPSNVKDGIDISILGNPDDFMIEFSIGDLSHSSTLLGLSTILFGGAILVLRGLRLKETMKRLENKFWLHLDEAIENIASFNMDLQGR